MTGDYWRDYDPIPRPYREYELGPQERRWIRFVQKQLALAKTMDFDRRRKEEVLRNCIIHLEHLRQKIKEILDDERKAGYRNDTLIHDYHKITHLLQRLDDELDITDPI